MKRKEKGGGGGTSKAYVLFKGGRRLKSTHGNRGEGVNISKFLAYVLYGRPLTIEKN